VCYVVIDLWGRTKWLWILVFNCVYVVNKVVLMFVCTCISSYFPLDVLAPGDVWCVVLSSFVILTVSL
jgi:hypothetical protein